MQRCKGTRVREADETVEAKSFAAGKGRGGAQEIVDIGGGRCEVRLEVFRAADSGRVVDERRILVEDCLNWGTAADVVGKVGVGLVNLGDVIARYLCYDVRNSAGFVAPGEGE